MVGDSTHIGQPGSRQSVRALKFRESASKSKSQPPKPAHQNEKQWHKHWADPIPSIVILTVIALVLAQFRTVTRIPGIRVIGMYAVYLFLAVIGAYCDLGAAYRIGELGITLLIFTSLTVLVHGLIIYSLVLLFWVDPVIASLASQANVGGGTSALAIARSLGREDLVLPSILIGSLGTAVGTFLGFWVSEYWMAFLQ